MSQHQSRPGEPKPQGLSQEELAAEQGRDLPDREAMSVLHMLPVDDFGNLAMPINQAIAENQNTNYSIADASAEQFVIVDQTATQTPPSA
jgi:hypothetical protein